ncbi:hypothetical protein PM082_022046 [Marasmius tenuissimus]|nr:hypothetical protein PM082_022046 [Marasmius tenuissimus]
MDTHVDMRNNWYRGLDIAGMEKLWSNGVGTSHLPVAETGKMVKQLGITGRSSEHCTSDTQKRYWNWPTSDWRNWCGSCVDIASKQYNFEEIVS